LNKQRTENQSACAKLFRGEVLPDEMPADEDKQLAAIVQEEDAAKDFREMELRARGAALADKYKQQYNADYD